MPAEETYPEDLLYHSEHDWARLDGEEGTFGVTWFAQDSLGEVVFFDPPEVGATSRRPSTTIPTARAGWSACA